MSNIQICITSFKMLNCSKQYVSIILKKAKDMIALKLKERGIIDQTSKNK